MLVLFVVIGVYICVCLCIKNIEKILCAFALSKLLWISQLGTSIVCIGVEIIVS